MSDGQLTASFRDPSGFLFRHQTTLYRQVNQSYQADYDLLMASGLYQKLVDAHLLIPHTEASLELSPEAYKILQPQELALLSYPYEWSFSQYQAAALATLKIQQIAFQHGMTLKDASAYNIQFLDGRALLIDTLSFEKYVEGAVWTPYRQFCQHFLAPLALMSYTDVRLSQLMRVYIDGIPLDLAVKLLPFRARMQLALFIHLYLHAGNQKRYEGKTVERQTLEQKTSRQAFLGLLDNLEVGVKKLTWGQKTAWADYYQDDSYNASAFAHKQKLVGEFIAQANPGQVWDLGGNTGVFSRLASQKGIPTICWDIDPGAVEANYKDVLKNKDKHLLPLVLDLTNPSNALGWAHSERLSVVERSKNVDLVMALALVHHLAIANNVPLPEVARFFASLGKHLIVEFVPKEDKKVQVLLATRRDIFPSYTVEGFEAAFASFFTLQRCEAITESHRLLYLMTRK